jgi:hypothetical protein
MVHIGDLSENMKVRARDGEELGTIIRLDARSILVEKGLFSKDYSVPIELVREVRDGDVYLSVPAEELRRATNSKFAERTLSDESLEFVHEGRELGVTGSTDNVHEGTTGEGAGVGEGR